MSAQIVRFPPDSERRSRNPDAIDRDLTESALIIILPVVRVELPNLVFDGGVFRPAKL
jgi:hypothetical protein